MHARLLAICSTATAGAPLHNMASATLEAGRGLVGDRYYLAAGTFSPRSAGQPDAELTLMESEEIERFNEALRTQFGYGRFRRNLVTIGVRLNDLVGRRFHVGDALVEAERGDGADPSRWTARAHRHWRQGVCGRSHLAAVHDTHAVLSGAGSATAH
jgi:hypothetical protein